MLPHSDSEQVYLEFDIPIELNHKLTELAGETGIPFNDLLVAVIAKQMEAYDDEDSPAIHS